MLSRVPTHLGCLLLTACTEPTPAGSAGDPVNPSSGTVADPSSTPAPVDVAPALPAPPGASTTNAPAITPPGPASATAAPSDSAVATTGGGGQGGTRGADASGSGGDGLGGGPRGGSNGGGAGLGGGPRGGGDGGVPAGMAGADARPTPELGGGGGADAGVSAGTANGGTAGGPSPASELDGVRFECPCLPGQGQSADGNCDVAPETDRQTIMKTMGGDADTVYEVTFRVRGLTEPNTYAGGTLEGERLYIGGTTTTAGYTSYMMTIADPAQHYFFNYSPTTGHFHFALDYEVTVQIRGGTQVTFDVDGDGSVPDGHQVANFDQMVIPDVPPAPDWFDGQFVQLDVVSVEVAP